MYLPFNVPPDILDYPTSTDMVVREGTNVTLRCAATGSPPPTITWRREGGESIPMGNGLERTTQTKSEQGSTSAKGRPTYHHHAIDMTNQSLSSVTSLTINMTNQSLSSVTSLTIDMANQSLSSVTSLTIDMANQSLSSVTSLAIDRFPFTLKITSSSASVEGPVFNITRVNRLHMGAYLCIASNGVPPTVSKRIMLIVHFPPMIWIQNQLVGAHEGQQMTLECHSEAYPKSINYWTREKGEIIAQGGKYEPVLLDNAYKVHMKLTIRSVGPSDFGSYKCVSKNSLGDTDGSIKLYEIPAPSTAYRTIPTTETIKQSEFEKKTKTRLNEEEVDTNNQEVNEIMNHSDAEKMTKERDLMKIRGRQREGSALELPVAEEPSSTSSSSSLPALLLLLCSAICWLRRDLVPALPTLPP
uniref:Ig-like domain-containing protein n=1 Tax=Timema bartmani TaxID=61472 RepID=A0A7R9HW35_9NEOP|nr:unnamed protein product [Timema bartmani]